MKRNHWLKIDNAGKIFPAVSNNSRSSTFRLSFELNELVDPVLLEKVVNKLLPRFDTFNVKLKKGLFWNHFAANNKYFKVEEENAIIGQYKMKSPSLYCFRVLYYQKRISLETFHALSDGGGAIEFLKSIVFEYLKEQGHSFDAEGKIVSERVVNPYEQLDGFSYSYDKKNRLNLLEKRAYKLKGEFFPDNWNLFIKATFNTEQFLKKSKSLGLTATQYVAALLIYAIYSNQPACKKDKKPIKIFIPVNLRKFFKVDTLRNFSLYIKISVPAKNKELSFDDIVEMTKKQFEEQLNKETLERRMNSNVFFEKNIFIRLVPLFIKNIAFKIGFKLVSDITSTSFVSNLGRIDLPSEMYKFINNADFVNAGEKLSLTMVTVKEKMNIIISTRLTDKSIIYQMIKTLQNEGLDVIIQTNHGE